MLFGDLFQIASYFKNKVMIMKKKYYKLIIIVFLILAGNLNNCRAAFINTNTKSNINVYAEGAGIGGYETSGDNIYGLVQIVINTFLSLLGVLFLIYMLYAGYNWMTAQGDEEKVTKAKDTIQRAVIGVIIVVAAYAISIFVIDRLEVGTLKSGAVVPGAGSNRFIA